MTCETRVPTTEPWGECPTMFNGYEITPISVTETTTTTVEITVPETVASTTTTEFIYDIGEPAYPSTTVAPALPETGASLGGTAMVAILFIGVGALCRRKARRGLR